MGSLSPRRAGSARRRCRGRRPRTPAPHTPAGLKRAPHTPAGLKRRLTRRRGSSSAFSAGGAEGAETFTPLRGAPVRPPPRRSSRA
ncbi:hypothetical protein B6R96_28145 [Streptomyces sp. Sge12]|nr:hypothetical protein B6R96_28145 [Streptomyces sp. Sge12]